MKAKDIRRPLSPADLAGHNCLRYPYAPFADGWHFLDADGNPVGARISGSLISSSPDTMHAAALAGIGLVMTVPLLIGDLLASGALVPPLPATGRRSWRSARSIPTDGT
jgi:DNA-binding transcriptional LysR family regulator